MASNKARGTKRTCQNPECGSRFYDLNRSPITCPICQSSYVIASSPGAVAPDLDDARSSKKPEFVDAVDVAPDEVPEVPDTESLTDIAESEEAVAAEEDETFLEEEEEDGGDMSGLIGDVAEDEEEA
jgi:uncharacterized protein (TIGR02300 family)